MRGTHSRGGILRIPHKNPMKFDPYTLKIKDEKRYHYYTPNVMYNQDTKGHCNIVLLSVLLYTYVDVLVQSISL